MASWRFMQLVDGAFPAGGFAHSQGLEAAVHLRPAAGGGRAASGVDAPGPGVERFLADSLWQVGRGVLPFVRAACASPPSLPALDALFDASCTSHVANRASRAQGRAFASTCARIFAAPASALAATASPDPDPEAHRVAAIRAIAAHARGGPAHHAPVFGAVFGALGLAPHEAQLGFLHGSARGVLSAAVRLGLIGPLEAQRVLADASALLDRIVTVCADIAPDDSAQAAPLVELFGALHDRLDGRLFQS